jgi:hypothetical protein
MIKQWGQAYEGASYDALLSKWAQLSDSYMTELMQACQAVATALDVAADVIVEMKVEAIAELVDRAAPCAAWSSARLPAPPAWRTTSSSRTCSPPTSPPSAASPPSSLPATPSNSRRRRDRRPSRT